MALTKSASLVEAALKNRKEKLAEAALTKTALDSAGPIYLNVWAREFDYVNRHITMPDDDIADAAQAYEELGKVLVKRLNWDLSDIEVHPQGSAATKTLIRSPDASKFDIDAVCSVKIDRVAAGDPMAFFDEVAKALEAWQPVIKNRCVRVDFSNKPFYIEFTPSVPISRLPSARRDEFSARLAGSPYIDTALAVVDRPTAAWKPSNPAGLALWVNDQARRQLLSRQILEKAALTFDAAVTPVSSQEVDLSDTLRIAIRLFKRHRDMSVCRNITVKEYAPISVILVTLLTRCYEGLADLGMTYQHPVELLIDLAELMPAMVERINGEHWVSNPTVSGENFAERWNRDDGALKAAAFNHWCKALLKDLNSILAETDEAKIRARVRDVFGCPAGGAPSTPPGSGGLAPHKPSKPYPAPATSGLA